MRSTHLMIEADTRAGWDVEQQDGCAALSQLAGFVGIKLQRFHAGTAGVGVATGFQMCNAATAGTAGLWSRISIRLLFNASVHVWVACKGYLQH